jgi:hypothetical protein
MSTRRARARGSDRASGETQPSIDRRTFLGAALAICFWPQRLLAVPDSLAGAGGVLDANTRKALEGSEFVYVSPLLADGTESTCHGEVWYGWLDDGVVLVTSKTAWKARSRARGLDRARLWVGDYGRWKRVVGRNESFRKGPSFDARVRDVTDKELLERLLVIYDEKYPAEIGKWRDRFREGVASGDRVLLRYEPLGT